MKKTVFSIFTICLFAITSIFAQTAPNKAIIKAPVGKWSADASHSNVKFTVTHLVVSEVDGSLKNLKEL